MAESSGSANAEQVRYWNEVAGPKWVVLQRRIDEQIRIFGERAMERAGLAAGDRVVDVGCGCGSTTIEIARRVGDRGLAFGIDISDPMLARAAEVAAAAGIGNARFRKADPQVAPFATGEFDAAFSRFGVMFFTDPAAAFRNLRAALRAGGRLAFACWQPLTENPWMFLPVMAAAQHLPLPPPPAPDAPGPFSFGDPGRVRSILEQAGFVGIATEELRASIPVGGEGADLDEAIDFLMQMGPAGNALREASPELRAKVAVSVREALTPHFSERGLVMDSAAWIVTARS